MSTYRIEGLPLGKFADLFDLSDEALRAQNIVRVHADEKPGFPCRVTLEDADVGETLLLLNYTHHPSDTPYHSSHAIFVRESARAPAVFDDQVPASIALRLISLRAFDRNGMMVDAEVVEGTALDSSIRAMLADPNVEELHIHNAGRGCFAARVRRA